MAGPFLDTEDIAASKVTEPLPFGSSQFRETTHNKQKQSAVKGSWKSGKCQEDTRSREGLCLRWSSQEVLASELLELRET